MRLAVRRATESDWPFIFSTYLTSNWFSQSNDTTLRKNTWMSITHKWLETLLTKSPPDVLVCYLEEDADFILGYMVVKSAGEPFTYVKKIFRAPEVNVPGVLANALERMKNEKSNQS